MVEDFSATLKEFSEKHGAVLLGMHHELKAIQASVEESKLALVQAQKLSTQASENVAVQQTELQNTKDAVNNDSQLWLSKVESKLQNSFNIAEKELVRAQAMGKQIEAKLIENTENEKARAQAFTEQIKAGFVAQQSEQQKIKDSVSAELIVQFKKLDAHQLSNAEMDTARANIAAKKLNTHIEFQRAELNEYKQALDAKQLEVGKLHELCLALLTEQKQREIVHQQKVEQLKRTFNKLGLAVLIVLVVGAILFGANLWMH